MIQSHVTYPQSKWLNHQNAARPPAQTSPQSRQLTLDDWARVLETEAARHQPESSVRCEVLARSKTAAGELRSEDAGLLTTREVADALHVHPRTVQRLVERGELAAVHLGSAVRFDPTDVGRLIARLKSRLKGSESNVADSVRARNGARASFAERLRSQTA